MRFLGATLLLMLAVSLQAAWALETATVKPAQWPAESTHEFAIFDQAGNRIATAYYRIIAEESNGREIYHIKYVGRNELISEAAECWIDPDTLKPMRSTRKVVADGRTFYQDIAYSNGVVIARRKYEGEEIFEQQLPAPGPVYDYEELLWLLPQLDFLGAPEVYLNLFVTIRGNIATVVVTDLGQQSITVQGETYTARGYGFEVNLTPHQLWTVMQDGLPVPARFQTGDNVFINLGLDPTKTGELPPVAVPPPAQPPGEPPAEPEPEPEPEEEEPEEEEEEPSDPGVNPLGPPPPGSRF
jgi:hypothetical protein